MNAEAKNLWISLGAAIFSIFLVYSYIQEKSFEVTKDFGDKKRVVVAKKDIKAMQTIDESMLEVKQVPAKFVSTENVIDDPNKIIGQIALTPLSSGETIFANKVSEPNPATGLSLQVAPTKRAITIPVNDVSATGRLLRPGDRIDILSTFKVQEGGKKEDRVHTVFQDITILATGHKIQNQLPLVRQVSGNTEKILNIQDDIKFSHVTVELTPGEAQDLIYLISVQRGDIYLTLRHPSDHGRTLFESGSSSETVRARLQQGRIPSSSAQ